MAWNGTFFNSAEELWRGGLEGYFTLSVETGGGVPTQVTANSPTQVNFSHPSFLARIIFKGQNLTVGSTALPNGTSLPVLTGGTITSIEFFYNYRLKDAIDAGVADTTPLMQASFLERSANISVPNLSAAALSQSIIQSYQAGSTQPFTSFVSQDTANFVGTAGVNFIYGFEGNDIVRGLAGNDVLTGNGGNDILDGGPGTDVMDGGAGSDLYLPGPPASGTPVGDSVSDSGTNPNDIDTISYANATSGMVIDLYLQNGNDSTGWATGLSPGGIESVIGSAFNDTIIGTDFQESVNDTAADILIGGEGDDTLYGLGGSDVLEGGPGFDVLIGGGVGQFGDSNPVDTARFNARNADLDVFYNGDGSVSVAAPGGGIDRLFEMEVIQTLDGRFNIGSFAASSARVLVGESGKANTLNDDNRNSLLFGRNGNDALSGGGGTDRLEGDAGKDTLNGGAGNDTIFGGDGDDVAVYSGAWKDYLVTRSGGTYTVKDLRSGSPDGTDRVFDVETLRFSNGSAGIAAALRDAPVSTAMSKKKATEGKTFSFKAAAHFSDADAALGDTLTYTATGLPSWLKINAATGVLSGKPSDVAAAKTINVTATDSHGLKISQGFSLTVEEPNSVPTKLKLSAAKVVENKKAGTLVGRLSATDPDGDALTFKLATNPGGMFKINGNKLVTNKRLDFEKLKSHTIGVTASDPDGLKVTKTFKIAVRDAVDVITGSAKSNKLVGGKGADLLNGKGGKDTLDGGAGSDVLLGGTGADKLRGGAGKDTQTGGGGGDMFVFKTVGDSTRKKAGRDIITDFSRSQKDKIDLAAIDAKSGSKKNDKFKFIEDDKFSGAKGELRFEKSGKKTFVYGDVDGNKVADIAIELTGRIDLVKGDFAL